MSKLLKDFYGHDLSISFNLIHNQEENGGLSTKKKGLARVTIISPVKSIASSDEENNDWYITIEKAFFYGHLVMDHLSYNPTEDKWSPFVCMQEERIYDPKNYCIADDITVEIL
jgi:hypothetical protein